MTWPKFQQSPDFLAKIPQVQKSSSSDFLNKSDVGPLKHADFDSESLKSHFLRNGAKITWPKFQQSPDFLAKTFSSPESPSLRKTLLNIETSGF